MAYTNEVELYLLQTGGQPPPVEVRVWEGQSVIVPRGPIQWHESVAETVSVPYTSTFTFSVWSGPIPPPRYLIGYSVHLGSSPGPLFRSGYFETLPPPKPEDPNGFVSIIEAKMVSTDQATLNKAIAAPPPAGLGSPPFTVPDNPDITVTALAVTIISGALRVDVSGTTTKFLGTPVGFSYTVDIILFPAGMVDTSSVIGAAASGPGSLSFRGTGQPGSGQAATFLSVIAGVVEGQMRANIVSTLESNINTAAIGSAAAYLGGMPPPTTLPPGVVLSASSIRIGTLSGVPGIHVVPAVSCFGSLRDRFPPPSPSSQRPCVLAALAFLGGFGAAPPLGMFRAYRDEVLLPTSEGGEYVTQYYKHSPEVIAILREQPGLRAAAMELVRALHLTLERQVPLTVATVPGLLPLVKDLLPHASRALKEDLLRFVAELK
jgi:hypothetical protein